jgi:hypothetical protein
LSMRIGSGSLGAELKSLVVLGFLGLPLEEWFLLFLE